MTYRINLSTPGISKLNNDEYAQFIKDILKLIGTTSLDKIGIEQSTITEIEEKLELLTEVSRQNRTSKESESIVKLDKQRSDLLSYLLSSFRVGRKSSLLSHQEAAQVLFAEFKNYKGVTTLPSRQKSQAIDALIKDLEKPNFSTHVNTLGIMHAVPALKEVNKKYQELVGVRSENQLAIKVINVKRVRKETDVLLKRLMLFAFSTNVVNNSPESTSFMGLLNKIVDDAMNANKQRLAQLLAGKKKSEAMGKTPKK